MRDTMGSARSECVTRNGEEDGLRVRLMTAELSATCPYSVRLFHKLLCVLSGILSVEYQGLRSLAGDEGSLQLLCSCVRCKCAPGVVRATRECPHPPSPPLEREYSRVSHTAR